jgi:predicted transcriptional regulator
MKIGIVGSGHFHREMKAVESQFSHVTMIPYIYETPAEASDIVHTHQSEVDAFLLAGSVPYFYAKERIRTEKISAAVARLTPLCISVSLFRLVHYEQVPFSRISFDLPNKEVLNMVLVHLDEKESMKHVFDYPWIFQENGRSSMAIEEFVSFHQQLYEAGKVDVCLTSIHAVHDALCRRNIRSMYVVQTHQSIIQGMKDAISISAQARLKKSQVAVWSIEAKGEDGQPVGENIGAKLAEFTRSLNGKLMHVSESEWKIITTRGMFEEAPKRERLLKDFEQLAFRRGRVAAGVGFGWSLAQAELHSQEALAYIGKKHASEAAVVCELDENKQLTETFFSGSQPSFKFHSTKNDDHLIRNLSQTLGVSLKNTMRMMDFLRFYPEELFTADDFANYLHVSRRSAERMIKIFHEHGFLVITGEEKLFDKGRARALYGPNAELKNILKKHPLQNF